MTGRSRWILILGIFLGGVCGPSCSRDTRPSVLLISIDTLRADAVGPESAFGKNLTPSIDALAAHGTTFTRATSVSPLTLPSHGTMLTGVRPGRHGLTVNGVAVPSLPVPSLAESLRSAGYQTAAFVSSNMLDHRHGLNRGFAHYDDDLQLPGGPLRPHERRGDVTVERAMDWLGVQQDPWFAWVHLYDPHAPYQAPGGRDAPPREAYADEVAFADQQVGRLLAAVEALGDDVLIVLTSDHGEGLGDHGEETHGLLLYESTMHVPLIFSRTEAQPGSFPQPGQLRDDVVGLLDITPTVLDLLGLTSDPQLEGRSLLRRQPPRSLPLEARAGWFYYGFSPLVGVRHGELKLLGAPESKSPAWRLHDLANDPLEVEGHDGAEHVLRGAVLSTAPAVEAATVSADAELRALGYVGPGGAPSTLTTRRDPRESMELIAAIDRANTLLVGGDASAALMVLEAQRKQYGDVAELQLFIGKAARALGSHGAARAALERAVLLQPASVGALHELAKVLMEQADKTEQGAPAVPLLLDQAEALVPGDPETAALDALYEVVFGDPVQALSRLAPALANRPHAANLLQVQVRALRALGRDQEAAVVEAGLR
ncbi:MAG: choline-sulfatase [Pseudohongiellaceae bacterium]